jgi:hypothetical protein
MFWLTVRQHRMQLLVTTGILAAIGTILLVHAVVTSNAMAGLSGDALDDLLTERVSLLHDLITWLPAAPALIGIFWGAPVLAREVENGTHLLAWTQSVSRRRWFLTKLAVLAAAVTLSGLALGAMITAWVDTFEGTVFAQKFADYGIFAVSGVAAGGWWLFAFMLGAAAGALTRKLLPAMAITLAVFFVAMFGLFDLRESYAEPARSVLPASAPMTRPQGDVMPVASNWLAPDGTEVDGAVPGCDQAGDKEYLECIENKGYGTAIYVHPADRYWRFQWSEAGVLAGAAVLLAGVAYQRVSRRSI